MSKGNAFASCLGYTVLFFITAVFLVLVKGWAVATMWGWFIVPLFDAPTLSYLQAYGLVLTASLFFESKSNDDKDKTTLEKLTPIFTAILTPIFVVFIGYIVLQYM